MEHPAHGTIPVSLAAVAEISLGLIVVRISRQPIAIPSDFCDQQSGR